MIHMPLRALAALALFAPMVLPTSGVKAQDGTAHVEAEARKVERDGEEVIQVDVTVRDVKDLGAFEFVLNFNGDLLVANAHAIEKGPFLGSSGREVTCVEPTIDTHAMRVACVTLGQEPRAGADGAGLLATVYFDEKGDGKTDIRFSRAGLLTPPGEQIATEWQADEIEVAGGDEGTNWLLWGGIAAAVVVVGGAIASGVALMRRNRSGVAAGDARAWSQDGE